MYGSEPSYSPYTQSPSPAGYGNPMTPGSIAPVSPAFNPLTPGAGMEETQADWVTTDIEVRINENHEVSLFFGDPFLCVCGVCKLGISSSQFFTSLSPIFGVRHSGNKWDPKIMV